MSTLSTFIQHSFGIKAQQSEEKKYIEGIQIGKDSKSKESMSHCLQMTGYYTQKSLMTPQQNY